jgi:replication protein RepL
MGKQIVYTDTIMNSEGELIQKRWIDKKVSNTEMFIRTYVEDIGLLAKCSGAEQSAILCCLKYLDYNTNRLYIDSQRRKEICDCSGMKENTLNTVIPRLVKKKILIKESNAAYLLNPKFFFFGSDIERGKVFDLVIRYTISTEKPIDESNG